MNIFRTVLVILLLFLSISAMGAEECVGENQTRGDKKCCSGLSFNTSTGKCWKDPSVVKGRSFCTKHEECEKGMGCFPQTQEDISKMMTSQGSMQDGLTQQQQAEKQQSQSGKEPVKDGGKCDANYECESYTCKENKCYTPKICRLAKKDEVASGEIACEIGLVKGKSQKCELSADDANPDFPGIDAEVGFQSLPKCQFDLPDEVERLSKSAFKSMRGLEFLFSQANGYEGRDCMEVYSPLKTVFQEFAKERREIIKNFNIRYQELENEAAVIEKSRQDSNKDVTVHGETLPEGTLATRKLSGFDTLVIMSRRNQLFMSFEGAMLNLIQRTSQKWTQVSKEMEQWAHNKYEWDAAGKHINGWDTKCRGGGFFQRFFESFIYFRWHHFYGVLNEQSVTEAKPENDFLHHYLWTISPMNEIVSTQKIRDDLHYGPWKKVIYDYYKQKYGGFFLLDQIMWHWLNYGYAMIDPLTPGSEFRNHGSDFGLEKIFGIKLPFRLLGIEEGHNLQALRTKFREEVKKFYQELNVDKKSNYIYEPELVSLEARDCIGSPDKPHCKEFKAFLDQVGDVVFAQHWAYSAHWDYRHVNYFTHATSYRPRFFRRMEVEFSNADKYYNAVIAERIKQNDCIEQLAIGLKKSGILTEDGGGINFGGGKYTNKNTNDSSSANTGKGNANKGQPLKSFATRFLFDLKTNKPLNFTANGSMMDGAGGKSYEASLISLYADKDGQQAMNQRREEMRKANEKATKAGVNVAAKEKSLKDALKVTGSNPAASGNGSGTNGALGSSGHGNGSHGGGNFGDAAAAGAKATLDANGSTSAGGDSSSSSAPDSSGSAASRFRSSWNGSSGSNSDSGPTGPTGPYQDRSGMSDEEKESMLADYERNKSKYRSEEGDDLFNILSKAYVRNYDKVMTKKKKIEED